MMFMHVHVRVQAYDDLSFRVERIEGDLSNLISVWKEGGFGGEGGKGHLSRAQSSMSTISSVSLGQEQTEDIVEEQQSQQEQEQQVAAAGQAAAQVAQVAQVEMMGTLEDNFRKILIRISELDTQFKAVDEKTVQALQTQAV
jgi:hypothetical protein